MINIEVIKAVIIPTKRIVISDEVKSKPNLTILSKLAPNITGIAKKNVNSAATVLDTPKSRAPTMVAPDLDVPGNMAAINWNIPIKIAVL